MTEYVEFMGNVFEAIAVTVLPVVLVLIVAIVIYLLRFLMREMER